MTSQALLNPADVRALAEQIGLRPSKQRGQNFMVDANSVRRIVTAAQLRPDDVVLEIGPGLGSLTLGLLEKGVEVVAVEIDDRLADLLPATVAARLPEARLRVINADALKLSQLEQQPTVLVANLPYNVAVPVLLQVLAAFPTIQRGLVLVQQEVADRLVAPPGSKVYGVPSVKLAWYADAQRVGSVPASVFWPVPHVESGLVSFTRHDEPAPGLREPVFNLIDAAFSARRKMLRAVLAPKLGLGSADTEALLRAVGIDPTARGETLGVADFVRLAQRYGSAETLVRERAQAKVNLLLHVKAKRPDGYHELVNVFQAVDLCDEVTASPASPGEFRVTVSGEQAAAVPTDERNLAVKAAQALAGQIAQPVGVQLRIVKQIPVAGGMAGGSADAAATLKACARLWEATDVNLTEVAKQIGADVPFALLGGTAVGYGRGDELTAWKVGGVFHWLLAISAHELSTPAVFRAFDELALPSTEIAADALRAALEKGDAEALGQLLHNDLQPAAVHLLPELAEVLALGERDGVYGCLVSGSGPTVAFLIDPGKDHAALVSSLEALPAIRQVRRVSSTLS
ncbi:MAG: 4-(cytidine 5'-diphospho)-2-C-methyl-D-erythritol kinase [Propionibacteriaceae bacterium]|jgi:16S rRNA (adenine1518-N6/adenine1519-N6)-dimethyltransferase|nr:4-(cytidine 5'-diphospho)-2-C-methyl-D-erythritol kinase [Propionibacteriaceae bacterium]